MASPKVFSLLVLLPLLLRTMRDGVERSTRHMFYRDRYSTSNVYTSRHVGVRVVPTGSIMGTTVGLDVTVPGYEGGVVSW